MTSATPRYRALATHLHQALHAGVYPQGSRLPSVRQLCQAHGLSLATVVHALHSLEDAGLIEARPRQGFFARPLQAAKPQPLTIDAAALDARRKRLMSLAASQAGRLSLSHLSLAPELLPLAALNRHISSHLRHHPATLAQGHAYGSAALREQLAQRAARRGAAVHAEDIVVTQGVGESLQLCLRMLSHVGDWVAVSSPASFRTLELLASLDRRVLELPASGDPAQVLQALEQALQSQPIACCIFETVAGRAADTAWDENHKQALATLLQRHQLPLVDCDLMAELHHDLSPPRPLKAFDREDWVLSCGSLACLIGPGFSLGHIASKRFRLQLQAARAIYGELIPDVQDQALAGFLASAGLDAHLRRLRSRLKTQVDAHRRAVLAHFPPGTRVGSGESGYALWVELPGGIDACGLLEALRPMGYTFIPGAVFSLDTRFDHCLRLAANQALDDKRAAGLQALGALACAALRADGA